MTAIATLAIGLGINTAVFSVAHAVLDKGFHHIDGNDRILYIGTQKNGHGCCVSYPDLLDWRAQTASFRGLGAVADLRVAVTDATGTESYIATEVTSNTFQLLGQQPILGRDFDEVDTTPGAPAVAILSHRLWMRRFGSNPSVLGTVARINGTATTIVGVMPEDFAFPQNQDLWLPLTATAARQARANRGLWFAFGRLVEGATFDSAEAELAGIGGRLALAYPDTNEGWVPQARTFAEFFIGKTAPTTYRAMWGAVGFVLLIACANLANLALARSANRSREFGIRLALGAGRWRIARQLLIESVMLSTAGGLLGWWIAEQAVRAYALWANPPGRLWSENLVDYVVDGRVLIYLAAISIGTGLLFGLAPALRSSSLDANTGLQEAGGRGTTTGRRATRITGSLIVAEMALAVVLLSGAGVMIRSFLKVSTVNLGVNTANTLAMLVNLPGDSYGDPRDRIAFFDRLKTRLLAVPGLDSVAIASALPTGGTPVLTYQPQVLADDRTPSTLSALVVGPDYFRTFGVAIHAGQDFAETDGAPGPPTMIVNEAFANHEWPGEDPIGKRVWFNRARSDGWRVVIGVVPNILQNDSSRSRQQFDPIVYLPYRAQPANNAWVIAHTTVPPAGLAPAFRKQVQSLDSNLPVWLGPLTVDQHLAGFGNYWITGTGTVLFVMFALVAMVLAAIGLYGVIAQAISQRTREIGVRIAIGASSRDILALVLSRGLWQVGVGLAIGLAASPALTRLLSGFLVQVSPADPLTMVVATAVLVATAACGCLIPARRALRIDPVVALRRD